ncbi:MAG: MerR family transcriptional regulator [Clostridia bacterium]|nr:MerR family transcriptional regulator [Clostridia bacterium]
MPDIRNCRRCGKMYNYIGGAPICPVCKEQDEEDFKRVKEYIYNHPGATISEVSTELEVSVEKIKTFLRDGRLEIVNGEGNMILECEVCGKSIRTGRFCDECSKSLSKDFASTAHDISSTISQQSEVQKKSIGMRYLNKDDKKR